MTDKPRLTFGRGDLSQIVRHIKMDPCRCVPFLGAGANVPSSTYSGLLLGRGLADAFLKTKDFQFEGSPCDKKNLAKVTLQFQMRSNRPDLIERLMELIPDENHEPSPLLRMLALLPFQLIVTTNYDRLMERAFELANKVEGEDFITIVQPPSGWDIRSEPRLLERFDDWGQFKGTMLYKIHGSFTGNATRNAANRADQGQEPEKKCPLVITEEDYIEFMTVMGARDGERVGIPDCIRNRMQRKMLLFLGYGLEDWDIRALYKGLIDSLEKDESRESFAIQRSSNDLWRAFWGHRRIRVKDFDLYKFADALHWAYFGTALGSSAPAPVRPAEPAGSEERP